MTQNTPENSPQEVAPGNGPAIDYDKLGASLKESLKDLLPQQAPPPPVAGGNDPDMVARIDALPEKIVNGIREAFAPAEPPKEENPPKEEQKPPGKMTFREWWGGQ